MIGKRKLKPDEIYIAYKRKFRFIKIIRLREEKTKKNILNFVNDYKKLRK